MLSGYLALGSISLIANLCVIEEVVVLSNMMVKQSKIGFLLIAEVRVLLEFLTAPGTAPIA